MQREVSGQTFVTVSTQKFPWAVRFVCSGFVAAGLLFPARALAGAEPASTLTVLVYNYTEASPPTVAAGEREASRILEAAGARIAWVNCWDKGRLSEESSELCVKGWTSQTPGLRLISGTDKFLYAEYGVASIPVYATIYYEKIARREHNDDSASELPTLLGCVIAHELGHLLGNPSHSTSEIM